MVLFRMSLEERALTESLSLGGLQRTQAQHQTLKKFSQEDSLLLTSHREFHLMRKFNSNSMFLL